MSLWGRLFLLSPYLVREKEKKERQNKANSNLHLHPSCWIPTSSERYCSPAVLCALHCRLRPSPSSFSSSSPLQHLVAASQRYAAPSCCMCTPCRHNWCRYGWLDGDVYGWGDMNNIEIPVQLQVEDPQNELLDDRLELQNAAEILPTVALQGKSPIIPTIQ